MNFNRDKAKKNIESILDKINSNDTDILLLKEYHKLYRKEISLFKRSMTAAWLFMYYDQKEIPMVKKTEVHRKDDRNAENSKAEDMHKTVIPKPWDRKTGTQDAASGAAELPVKPGVEEKTQVITEVTLHDEESKKLFISIGKNRRLFPKEIVTLIMTNSTVAREDIGIIRILDNYSFVQVRDTKADEIIESLNGIRFRGRTLTVNYAKPKD